MAGTDLEVLLCGGLDDSSAKLASASSAGISLKRDLRPLRPIANSPILQIRRLRPGEVPKVILVL